MPAGAHRLSAPAVLLERDDLRQKVRETRQSNLILFVVDASGSMAARDRMSAAKGAALALLLDAYRKRDQVGLVAFRGRGAELLLPPTNSVDLAERRLRELPTGGRTPLADGLALARQTVERYLAGRPAAVPLLVVITDGRANVALGQRGAPAMTMAGAATTALAPARRDVAPTSRQDGGMGPLLAELDALGWSLQRAGVAAVVIDSEAGAVRLGMAQRVARALGASYLPLDQLDAARLTRAVREVRG
jgi:magnesium chelatase subunit D